MKITNTVILIVLALTLAGCKHSSSGNPKTPMSNANGHYLIEPFTLDGPCENPEAFEIVIWQAQVYENPESSPFQVDGTLIKDARIEAIATANDGTIVSFIANLDDYQHISGEWESLDGSCLGYLTGERILEL